MPSHKPSSTVPTLAAADRAATHDTGATGRTHLSVEGVSVAYTDRRVLTDVSFTARRSDRLGLVGENGTGKSTLLRVIAGSQAPDEGSVVLPGTVDLLEQQLPYPDDAPIQQVLDDAQRDALDALIDLELRSRDLATHPDDPNAAEAYAHALEFAERCAAWDAEAVRGEMLSGLGLAGLPQSRSVGNLSGGQRLRLALAAILLRAPHTLLLDEPSNHLDDASSAYLERVLRDWPGIVIFASHDRALLDAVATKILDLDPLPVTTRELSDDTPEDPGAGVGVRLWGVGYSAARTERAAEMRRWNERYAAEAEQLRSLEHEIEVGAREVNRKHESKSESRITRKFYADKDARVTARRARNARVRLETLERERIRRPPEPLQFRGFESEEEQIRSAHSNVGASRTLLRVDRVALPGRLTETSLEVGAGDKLLLAGPNGAGKSTLLAILAAEIEPATGTVERSARIGYLPQEVMFEDGTLPASEAYRQIIGYEVAEHAPLESTGLLQARDIDRNVCELSVGQRRRLALAALVADPPPVLLLDEPTNHFSLTLVEELEEALQRYTGALVVASHDRWLRERWRGSVLHLEGTATAVD